VPRTLHVFQPVKITFPGPIGNPTIFSPVRQAYGDYVFAIEMQGTTAVTDDINQLVFTVPEYGYILHIGLSTPSGYLPFYNGAIVFIGQFLLA